MISKHITHIENLRQNLKEVRRLLDIHEQISGKKPGYKSKVEVINKSCVVLLVACWEAYIEDLGKAAFEFLLVKAKKPDVFPSKILVLASKELKSAADERLVWKLAGKGWIKILNDHKEETLGRYINNFNTPRADMIDHLFENLIGYSRLSENWHWFNMTFQKSQKKLSDLITLRGSIAHRVSTTKRVHKSVIKYHLGFIIRLAVISNNRVAAHLHKLTKETPWQRYHHGKVK
ncbi:MAG: HEPN domain-containing protein [bacterium]